MKKIIYLSIVLVTLSLTSCRDQEDMVQLNDVKPTNVAAKNATNNDSTNYTEFNSSSEEQGDPTKPPKL
ncbi:hypothetical protein [Halpernia sp.]|uniref:hypothetical protein n=1 Tax=Halpernia sp. TaxID=2782209 RepID=UPI003A93963B